MIKVKTNVKTVVLDFKKYTKALDDANYQAVRKVTAQAKTFSSKEIRAEYNIKKVDLDKNIITRRPVKVASSYQSAIIGVKRDLPLAKFGARQLLAGVSVAVKKGIRKVIPEHFIATMKSGHKGVYVRRKSGDKRVARLPIDEKFAKGAGHLITKKIFSKIEKFVETKFPKLLEHEINYRTKK